MLTHTQTKTLPGLATPTDTEPHRSDTMRQIRRTRQVPHISFSKHKNTNVPFNVAFSNVSFTERDITTIFMQTLLVESR